MSVVPERRLILIGAALLLASVAFLTLGAKGSWSFVLPLRGTRLAALALVGSAIGVATVLFQTASGNRILTPSIMGFDSLYLLIQSTLVFSLGGVGYAMIDGRLKFVAESLGMMAAAAVLFAALIGRGRRDLHRMLLVGVIFGVLFRSLSSLALRLIDPNAFVVVQAASFARFTSVKGELLAISVALSLTAFGLAWAWRRELDVAALGREAAITLGVDYERLIRRTLLLVALLVSVSTALVGPVAFLGLLVASLAYVAAGAPRHALTLPAAALIGALTLVAGQTIFERVLGLAGTLGVVVEFVGGLLFLFLLLRRRAA